MPQRAGEKLISAGTSSGVCPACGVAWWPDTLSDSGQPATGPTQYRQVQCRGT